MRSWIVAFKGGETVFGIISLGRQPTRTSYSAIPISLGPRPCFLTIVTNIDKARCAPGSSSSKTRLGTLLGRRFQRRRDMRNQSWSSIVQNLVLSHLQQSRTSALLLDDCRELSTRTTSHPLGHVPPFIIHPSILAVLLSWCQDVLRSPNNNCNHDSWFVRCAIRNQLSLGHEPLTRIRWIVPIRIQIYVRRTTTMSRIDRSEEQRDLHP